MDAFYASVEERDDPSPRRQAGDRRRHGRRTRRRRGGQLRRPASSACTARCRPSPPERLCPQAVFLPVRMDHYAQVSQQIREIFEQFTPLVEPLSLDEAFLDVTGSEPLFGPAAEIGRQIKQQIRDEVQLVASVGVAPNKFLAKIASDLQKPDGLVVVEPDRCRTFSTRCRSARLWGVGKVTGKVFERLGIRTIGQLRGLPVETLKELFGAAGEHYWQLARGIDDRRVVPDREAKSISARDDLSRPTSTTWRCCGPGCWSWSSRWPADSADTI